MSEKRVSIRKISSIKKHPNADTLDLITIDGWQTCAKNNSFNVGQSVVFFQPDAVLPEKLHTYLGVTNYCAKIKNDGRYEENSVRVKAIKLRGEPSFGLIATVESISNFVGKNITHCEDIQGLLGVEKYEPQSWSDTSDNEKDKPNFFIYTDIKRYQNFPHVIKDGENVVILEKLHGRNCRVGLVDGMWVAGSHKRRKKPVGNNGEKSLYWTPLEDEKIKLVLSYINSKTGGNVIIYCELVGPKMQNMTYNGIIEYPVFDISVNGRYLNWTFIRNVCEKYSVQTVPELYIGPFSKNILMQYTDGPTVFAESPTCKFKGREGVVVRPLRERTDKKFGRVILKSISVDYLEKN